MPRKMITIRLKPEVIQALDEIAKREKRTRNKVIELILSGEIITSEDLRREIENIKKLEG